MINLTKDQIILLHEQLINSFGGIHGMLVLLELNDIHIEYDDDELIEIIQEVAAGVLSQEGFHLWVSERINKG